MTGLVITGNKHKYGTGQFRQNKTLVSSIKNTFDFEQYANQIKPINGNDTKGIFKWFANLIFFDSAYPTQS